MRQVINNKVKARIARCPTSAILSQIELVRVPTNVTERTDERDRWGSADAWCSNCTLIGHDDRAQGCP